MKESQCSEDQRPSASRNIPRIVWNSKVYYRFLNSPSHIPIINQLNPLHVLPFHVFQTQNNIILPSGSFLGPVTSKLSLSFKPPPPNLVRISFLRVTCLILQLYRPP